MQLITKELNKVHFRWMPSGSCSMSLAKGKGTFRHQHLSEAALPCYDVRNLCRADAGFDLQSASPATRLLEKRRATFEVQEALELQKTEFAKRVRHALK